MLVGPHVRAVRHLAAQVERIELQQVLAARPARREVGLEHVVALEAVARHVVEEQGEQRHEVLGFEQVHVERVLEVGRARWA